MRFTTAHTHERPPRPLGDISPEVRVGRERSLTANLSPASHPLFMLLLPFYPGRLTFSLSLASAGISNCVQLVAITRAGVGDSSGERSGKPISNESHANLTYRRTTPEFKGAVGDQAPGCLLGVDGARRLRSQRRAPLRQNSTEFHSINATHGIVSRYTKYLREETRFISIVNSAREPASSSLVHSRKKVSIY